MLYFWNLFTTGTITTGKCAGLMWQAFGYYSKLWFGTLFPGKAVWWMTTKESIELYLLPIGFRIARLIFLFLKCVYLLTGTITTGRCAGLMWQALGYYSKLWFGTLFPDEAVWWITPKESIELYLLPIGFHSARLYFFKNVFAYELNTF